MKLRICFVAALSALAACSAASGRGGDLGTTTLPMCPSYPHGFMTVLATATSTALLAGFQQSGNRACTTMTEGSCSAQILAPLPLDAGIPPFADAGVLSVDAADLALMQSPMSGGSYQTARTSSVWSGGEPIRVAAAGGEVPAFATTLTAPSAATLTMPAARPTTIARGGELALSWSGAGAGVVDVLLSAATTGMSSTQVECRYPVALGQGVVPAAILGTLPAGSMGILVMTTETAQTVQASGWSVDVALERVLVDQSGAALSASVTFN